MCCDDIHCTNEDTDIEMREADFKPMTGGFRNLHVKLSTLLPSTVAIESIAILDTDDIQGQLHKSFSSMTHAHTCARAHTYERSAYFPFSLQVVSFFSLFWKQISNNRVYSTSITNLYSQLTTLLIKMFFWSHCGSFWTSLLHHLDREYLWEEWGWGIT